ncbi:M14 family murein peptide amidase A [Sinimarinibacterium sp. NLF-5-8]|uniref:M14 family murein peptide amidase A n=1 Tax=Sinimarinibacterium sp. NLF-5-8 TaxID=2698684 RepID=UPI001EE4D1E2|nr:M14 family murein peptide amidase A [Sinimarinibacterium sp. NLF-5-8]
MAVSKRLQTAEKARRFVGLFLVGAVLAWPMMQTARAQVLPSAPPRDQAGQFPLMTQARACELIGGKLQSVGVARCLRAGLRMSGSASVHGVPLLYRDFPASSRRGVPQRILLLGGIHGDELSSVSIVFNWMDHLERSRFLPFHWRVIPNANPDGLLQRKATRGNANGVDLNRNFPTLDWQREAMTYWEKRTHRDPRRYPGPAALSEPETRWLVEQIRQFRPDAIVSVHAPFGLLDFDGPREPPQRFGYLHLHQLGTYPGSLGNYAGVNLGLPVITLELPHAGIMPTPQQQARIWADMLTWLERNLPREAPLYFRLGQYPWEDVP